VSAEFEGLPKSIVLNLTSQWSQGSPYNDACAELVPGVDCTRVAAGCVAVAMSQVMYYWQWPNSGEGSYSGPWYPRRYASDWLKEPLALNPNKGIFPGIWSPFQGQCFPAERPRLEWTSSGVLLMIGYWDVSVLDKAKSLSDNTAFRAALDTLFWNQLIDDRETYSVNFGKAHYAWDMMTDLPSAFPHPGNDEVAEIMHHTGVAIGTRWGVFRTSGENSKVPKAMKDNFRYDPNIFMVGSFDIKSMITEIMWMRPLILGGTGHAWVAYGFDRYQFPDDVVAFKMNMGWGPATSGVWYTVDGDENSWSGNPVEDFVSQIAPRDTVKFVGNSATGDGSPDSPYKNVEKAIAKAEDGATLIFKAGSVNTFSAPVLKITKPVTLKGQNAIIRPNSP